MLTQQTELAAVGMITAAGLPFEEIQQELQVATRNLAQTQIFFIRTVQAYQRRLQVAKSLEEVQGLLLSQERFLNQVELYIKTQLDIAPGKDYCSSRVILDKALSSLEVTLARKGISVVENFDQDLPNLPIDGKDLEGLFSQTLLVISKLIKLDSGDIIGVRTGYLVSPLHKVFQFICQGAKLDLEELLEYLNYPDQYTHLELFQKIGLEMGIIQDLCKKHGVIFEVVKKEQLYIFSLGFRRDDIR